MPKGYFICYSCGKKMEYASQKPPCEVLTGWLTVSQWKGLGAVEHRNFCSFTCLKRWADAQVPKIPKVFLKAFEEGKGSENACL